MKAFKIFIVYTSILLAACSNENDCNGFPSGSIKKIKDIVLEDKVAYLYLRTSGFQDKQFFYELYDHKPQFNSCNVSSSEPILEDHLFEQGAYANHLVIKNDKMEIIYSDTKPENYNLELLNITVE